MFDTNKQFSKITKGGFFFSGGYFLAIFLQFFVGIIVVRYLKRSEYGLLALANIIVGIIVTLCTLGFSDGIPRFMGFNLKRFEGKTSSFIPTVFTIVIVTSFLGVIFLYFQAPNIRLLFNKFGLDGILKPFAFMIAPLVFIRVLTSIFRGLEQVTPKVLFQDIATNLSRLLLVLLVISFGLGLQGVTLAYVLAAWITFGAYLLYAKRHLYSWTPFSFDSSIAKDLVLFSLPLMGAGIISNLLGWLGTLFLGYFSSADQIGLYNAPLRLASLVSLPLIALVFLYLPVLSKNVSKKSFSEIGKYYSRTTKWGFLGALCLLLYFLYDAEFVVTKIFGSAYLASSEVLKIMAVGFSIHAFMGPNGATLISLGHTGTIFSGTLLSGIFAFVLCILFVPRYGAIGAAFAMATARIISNIFFSATLYLKAGIHPFNRDYLKPVLCSGLLILVLRSFVKPLEFTSNFEHVALFLVIFIVVILAPFVTRSVEETDFELLGEIEYQIRKSTKITDKIASLFRHRKDLEN
ncbi:MAG: hypothetical protein DRG83_08420 [Deltaproteobacteria bacterium]|nr:MAG: hypothetical protein DRG83_08420 [Deltaproteobacteria bacterium]